MSFSIELKKIRVKKKLSQREMAKKLGVTQGAISKIEDGRENPKLSLLKSLRVEFSFNVNKFLDRIS